MPRKSGMFRNRPNDVALRLAAQMPRVTVGVRSGGCAAIVVLLIGCQGMDDQPRVKQYAAAHYFADGIGSRPQVAGTIARGQTGEIVTGRENGKYLARNPEPIAAEQLAHGRSLFEINCQHCHGPAGYGDGLVVQRGFPPPPSYHTDRLRTAPDGRLFEQMTLGNGRMPSFGQLLSVRDRWALVAFVRALQLSQHAQADELTKSDLEKLAQ